MKGGEMMVVRDKDEVCVVSDASSWWMRGGVFCLLLFAHDATRASRAGASVDYYGGRGEGHKTQCIMHYYFVTDSLTVIVSDIRLSKGW